MLQNIDALRARLAIIDAEQDERLREILAPTPPRPYRRPGHIPIICLIPHPLPPHKPRIWPSKEQQEAAWKTPFNQRYAYRMEDRKIVEPEARRMAASAGD